MLPELPNFNRKLENSTMLRSDQMSQMEADIEASELIPLRPVEQKRPYINRNIENVINSMPEAQVVGSRASSNDDQLGMNS